MTSLLCRPPRCLANTMNMPSKEETTKPMIQAVMLMDVDRMTVRMNDPKATAAAQ